MLKKKSEKQILQSQTQEVSCSWTCSFGVVLQNCQKKSSNSAMGRLILFQVRVAADPNHLRQVAEMIRYQLELKPLGTSSLTEDFFTETSEESQW